MEKNIVNIRDISFDTEEGKLLFVAVGVLMSRAYTHKTPEEIIGMLNSKKAEFITADKAQVEKCEHVPESCGKCDDCVVIDDINEIACVYMYRLSASAGVKYDNVRILNNPHTERSPDCPKTKFRGQHKQLSEV